MRALNLYAGVGGNRKLWVDCDVVAVESNREYRFEYMPEDIEIRVIDLRKAAGGTSDAEETTKVRLLPSKPVLPVERGDSVEPPLRVPRL